MNFLVYFTAYCWDNYQGGSGSFINMRLKIEIDSFGKGNDIWRLLNDKILDYLKNTRPYCQNGDFAIEKVELI